MAIGVGDILRISANLLLESVADQVNVYHFQVGANTHPNDTAVMTDIASLLDTAYTLVNASISAAVAYQNVTGQNLTKSELLPDTAWPVLTVGGNVADRLPDAVSAEVYWGTIRPKVVGRKFLPNMTENFNSSSQIVAGTLTQLANFGAYFLVPLVTANLSITAGTWNPTLAQFTPFLTANVPTAWRTQRRRRRGVGS